MPVSLVGGHVWDGVAAEAVEASVVIDGGLVGGVGGEAPGTTIDVSGCTILPGLIEWAVKEVGAARLLYGTDTPLYSASMQRARIDTAGLCLEEKQAILRDNAVELIRSRIEVDLTPVKMA